MVEPDAFVDRVLGVVGFAAVVNAIARNAWSAVAAALFVETRSEQCVELARPFAGACCPGARQLKSDCGLSPTKGRKARFLSVEVNVAKPRASAIAGAGDDPRSQCAVGDH